MAIFRGGKRVGPFDIRIGLPRGTEYDNIPGDPRLKQRANPETTLNRFRSAISKAEGVARNTRFIVNISLYGHVIVLVPIYTIGLLFKTLRKKVLKLS